MRLVLGSAGRIRVAVPEKNRPPLGSMSLTRDAGNCAGGLTRALESVAVNWMLRLSNE